MDWALAQVGTPYVRGGETPGVGIYVGTQGGQAVMVDAPHTGAEVRTEPFPPTVGAQWGTDVVIGFIDPAK
ncbi:MAG: hypothetical protein ACYDEY_14110 [Acidimicrobiales bacterium]